MTRNLGYVVDRLGVLKRGLEHLERNFDWQRCSTEFDFVAGVYQALWSGKVDIPLVLPSLLPDDFERIRFLQALALALKRDNTSTGILSIRWVLQRLRQKGVNARF